MNFIYRNNVFDVYKHIDVYDNITLVCPVKYNNREYVIYCRDDDVINFSCLKQKMEMIELASNVKLLPGQLSQKELDNIFSQNK